MIDVHAYAQWPDQSGVFNSSNTSSCQKPSSLPLLHTSFYNPRWLEARSTKSGLSEETMSSDS